MTDEELKQRVVTLIAETVNESGPLRTTEVITRVITKMRDNYVDFEGEFAKAVDLLPVALGHCIGNKQIVELEYIHPNTDYKVSSLLFPKNTVFHSVKLGSPRYRSLSGT